MQEEIQGEIGYHDLVDWWLTAFSEQDRLYIERRYDPCGSSSRERPLTQGTISLSSRSATAMLSGLSSWFGKPHEYQIACRIFDKGGAIKNTSVIDRHFLYHMMITTHYRMREVYPSALAKAIAACHKQIELAPKTAKVIRPKHPEGTLPVHTGYTQLAIILEKRAEYGDAIVLCHAAQKQGWFDDWEKRIARCRKKLMK